MRSHCNAAPRAVDGPCCVCVCRTPENPAAPVREPREFGPCRECREVGWFGPHCGPAETILDGCNLCRFWGWPGDEPCCREAANGSDICQTNHKEPSQ